MVDAYALGLLVVCALPTSLMDGDANNRPLIRNFSIQFESPRFYSTAASVVIIINYSNHFTASSMEIIKFQPKLPIRVANRSVHFSSPNRTDLPSLFSRISNISAIKFEFSPLKRPSKLKARETG